MIEKEFVNESIFRTKMFINGIPSLKKELIKESKRTKTPFRKMLVNDAIQSLKEIEKTGDFNYYQAFVFQVCFSQAFENLKIEIVEGKHDLKKDFFREDYWRNEEVKYKDALYFSYPFIFDSYKTEISIDMKKLSEVIDKSLKTNKPEVVGKTYFDFMKKIIKKSN